MTIVETNNNKYKVPDAPHAYSQFKNAILTSLADGSFIKLLKASGLSSFANVSVSADSFKAQAYTVKYTDLSPTVAPTAAPTVKNRGKLSSAALLGIIAAGIFIATLALLGLYFYAKTYHKRESRKVAPTAAVDMDMDSRSGLAMSRKKPNLAVDIDELELSSLGDDDDVDNDEADVVLETLKETWIADLGNVDSRVSALEPIDNSVIYFGHSKSRPTIPTDDYISIHGSAAAIKYAVEDGRQQPSINTDTKAVLVKFPKINTSDTSAASLVDSKGDLEIHS